MDDQVFSYIDSHQIVSKVSELIDTRKKLTYQAVNTALVFLNWEICETITLQVLKLIEVINGLTKK